MSERHIMSIEAANPVEFYVDQLKSITKEYPKDHPRGKEYGGYHFVVGDTIAIESEFGEKLMNEIEQSKPDQIVEVGTGRGYSTSWILLGMMKAGKGNLTTFDKELKRWNVPGIPGKLIQYIMDFRDVTDELPSSIDFVFHDGAHIPEDIMRDMDKILPKMSEKGKIWIHDAYDEISHRLKHYFGLNGWNYDWIKESSHLGFAVR